MKSLSTPAYEHIRDILRKDIISGAIPAGTKVTIATIAKKYHVSHMPVREAFQWLQGEGLLDINPHKGAQVIQIDKQFVQNIYQVRGAIEALLGKLSVNKLEDADLRKMENLHEQIINTKDIKKFLELNYQFHIEAYKKSNNKEAMKIYGRYHDLLKTVRLMYGLSEDRFKRVHVEHQELLDAFKLKDSDMVEKIIKRHTLGAMEEVVTLM